ncbi:hypothetical protein MPH_07143 [Macrophomina phaseolina MS6]|uniref:Uncharacterized protein n=1 Tax=Macrophomina phaseolina (strain MS6) TaxID=1126212 RepID=K2RLX7_MACPH|nr:hypothetical protein MPH_07143 [Macrophomina phaseolina MS6]
MVTSLIVRSISLLTFAYISSEAWYDLLCRTEYLHVQFPLRESRVSNTHAIYYREKMKAQSYISLAEKLKVDTSQAVTGPTRGVLVVPNSHLSALASRYNVSTVVADGTK